QTIAKKQRNGVIHAYTIDTLGRQTGDDVTFPQQAVVDTSITGLHTRYDIFGRPDLFTSVSMPDPISPRSPFGTFGPESAVCREYNGFGEGEAEYQQHGIPSIVFTGSNASAVVGYSYSDAAHGSRLQSIHYPGGSTVIYGYNPGLDDRIGRVSFIGD